MGVKAQNPRMCVAVMIFVHEQYIVHGVIKRLVLFSLAAIVLSKYSEFQIIVWHLHIKDNSTAGERRRS